MARALGSDPATMTVRDMQDLLAWLLAQEELRGHPMRRAPKVVPEQLWED